MIRISDIKICIDEAPDQDAERRVLHEMILLQLKIGEQELLGSDIYKKSIDARKKDKIFYVYTVDVKVRNEKHVLGRCNRKDMMLAPEIYDAGPRTGQWYGS